MNILIIAVLILSLLTAFCAGAEFGRSREREEHQFHMAITTWEADYAEYAEDEDLFEM